MIAGAVIILAGFVLVAFALTISHHADRVIDEILAAELRQIDRERKRREYDANLAERWRAGR
jgi:hypothetical protein